MHHDLHSYLQKKKAINILLICLLFFNLPQVFFKLKSGKLPSFSGANINIIIAISS